MAGSNQNNGYVLTDEETKIFFGLTCEKKFYVAMAPTYYGSGV